jgi:mono/diheme cytochrome c family protein
MRARRTGRGPSLAALIVLAAAGTVLALPWTQQMLRGGAVQPQTLMLVPPPNTLAIGHPRILDRIDAEESLANPIDVSPAVLDEARGLFATYCAVCHGADGRSTGPVGRRFQKVPDLADPAIQGYPDGLLYSVIREGGFDMPGYADALSAPERWALVHFIRSLRQP